MKKTRNANIEIFRILSVIAIVTAHYCSFGFFAEELDFSRNKIFVDLLDMWGHTGLYLLTLIGGYFMVGSKLRLKKIFSLMGCVWFYSIGFFLIFTLSGLLPPDHTLLKISFFPLLTMHYWYISYYILMLLLSPFINRLLGAMDRRAHAALCLLLFIQCILLPKFTNVVFVSGPLPMFMTIYFFGAYIRLYARPDERLGKRNLRLTVVFLLLCALMVAGIDVFARRTGNIALLEDSTFLMDYTSPFALTGAVLILLSVCSRPPRQNSFLSRVGSLTIGAYLFHANQLFTSMVWQRVFHTSDFTDSPWLPLHAAGTILCLFTAGCLVEWLRQKTVGRLWDRLIDAALPMFTRMWNSFAAFLLRAWDGLLGVKE